MKLMTVKQLMKKSKSALIRKITKSLKTMPKKKLCMLCYQMGKTELPRLKSLPASETKPPKRKTKSKKKLKPGLHFVKINGVMRKVRVLKNGKWRFEKMVTSLSSRRR